MTTMHKEAGRELVAKFIPAFLLVMVLTMLFVLVPVIPAQAADPVIKNGKCPQESDLRQLRKTLENKGGLLSGGQIPQYSWILQPEKIALYEKISVSSKSIPLSRVQPLDRVEIVGSSSDGEFWLVRIQRLTTDERGRTLQIKDILCGWLEANVKDGLLPWDEDSGFVKPLTQGQAPLKYRVRDSIITLKAVVHSLGGGGATIPLYATPEKEAKKLRHLQQFEILDVFAWEEDPATKNLPPSRKKFYYLLGRKGASGLAPEILGWAYGDDIAIWSTRMAAFWTGKGGKGYERPRGRGAVLLKGPVGIPDAGNTITRKYPVLTTLPDNRRLTRIARQKSSKEILRQIEDVRLVVPGQACRDREGKQCIPPEQLEALKARIQAKKRELNKIDIVFLIDGTRSMTRYFAPVARGVRDFVNNLQVDEDIQIRVAASIYGDYRGSASGRNAVQYERVVARHDPIDTNDIDALVERAQEGYLRDPQRDKLEAPFAAILQTLADDTRWGEHEGFRYLVHIADHGNRLIGEGAHVNLTRGHEETVSLDDVVKALRRRHIAYVPIAVRGDGPGEARRRFRQQAREIVKKLGAYGRALQVVEGGPEITAEEVRRFLELTIKVRREALDRLALIQTCHEYEDIKDPEACVAAVEKGGTFIAQLATAFLERTAIGKEMAEVSGYVQRTLPVWVPPFQNGKQVIDFWLMLEPEKTQALAKFTQELCKTFRPGNLSQGQKILKDALEETLGFASGDDSGSPSEILRRQLFIPGWAVSDLFGKPWKTLNDYIQQTMTGRPDLVEKWNRHFCRKAYLLRGVSEGDKRLEDENLLTCEYDEDEQHSLCTTPSNNVRKFKWFYDFGNRQRFYFIPLRYLP